ncbi:helix-turn-helix transcriptional regulator [Parafrankia sp. EUN1f]|uniref:helix-turn-helix domain-containing protein n=1 Tax=Parafrankia sp. EUN1f TaxID=102897 RepID=UPI0001C4533F|nr:helix-turn-helix transcriptional regulator [Parafrankia sp. EUN1f]EFC78927.1 transcriptional regulator, XRE family [Parafrankia sp. EUN1f]
MDALSPLDRLGAELRRRRMDAGLTQDRLAVLAGYPKGRTIISKCERGRELPSERFIERIDAVLEADGAIIKLYRQAEAARLRHAADDLAPPEDTEVPQSGLATVPRLDRTPDLQALSGECAPAAKEDTADRRQLLQGGLTASLGGMSAASFESLTEAGDSLGLLGVRPGCRIDAEIVDILAGRVHALRLADDVLAGGDLIGPAFRELASAVQLCRESRYAQDVGQALLTQVGELAQIAGWIASDAGRHDQAEHAYTVGISAARQANDGPLVAHLMSSLAYQLANTGRRRESIDLAQAAIKDAGRKAPARTRALFFDRLAWTYTQASEPQPAIRALGAAHDALTDDRDDAPQWAYWVSSDELDVMDARVYTEMHRPLRAVPLLNDALGRYNSTHTREVALYRSWLAIALADANEPEQAAVEARRVLTLSAGVPSNRTADRSRVVLRRLHDFGGVPEVSELLEDYGHLLGGRRPNVNERGPTDARLMSD